MLQLSEHFSTDGDPGFSNLATGTSQMITNARFLCDRILEPLRNHFGKPVHIHCAWRPPSHNAAVGGKATSFHLFLDGKAAVDIHLEDVDLQETFDWLRLESGLPFDKVILEKSPTGLFACVHIQVDSENEPRRMAFIGYTGACEHYQPMEVKMPTVLDQTVPTDTAL